MCIGRFRKSVKESIIELIIDISGIFMIYWFLVIDISNVYDIFREGNIMMWKRNIFKRVIRKLATFDASVFTYLYSYMYMCVRIGINFV